MSDLYFCIGLGIAATAWAVVKMSQRSPYKSITDGFDAAAGELLRGVPLEIVENNSMSEIDRSESAKSFDLGVRRACNAWRKMKGG